MLILDAVRSAHQFGLCLLPVAEDGSKRPDVGGTWRAFQVRRPTVEDMRAFDFAARAGCGLVAGAVVGHRECWDFDCADVYQAFVAAADACGLGDVVQRIVAGYEDQTPGGGRRWIVAYPESVEWKDCTLARRPGRDGEPTVKTLIELPTFSIVAPSKALSVKAVDTLADLLDAETPAAVRLGAARTVIEIGLHQRDADEILLRLDQIETAQRRQQERDPQRVWRR